MGINILAAARKVHKRMGMCPAASTSEFLSLRCILLSANERGEGLRVRGIGCFGGLMVLGFEKVSGVGSVRVCGGERL